MVDSGWCGFGCCGTPPRRRPGSAGPCARPIRRAGPGRERTRQDDGEEEEEKEERIHKPKSQGLRSTMWERRAPVSWFSTNGHTSRPVRRSMATTRTQMRAGESGLCMHTSMDDNENKTPKRPAPSIDRIDRASTIAHGRHDRQSSPLPAVRALEDLPHVLIDAALVAPVPGGEGRGRRDGGWGACDCVHRETTKEVRSFV